MIVIGRSGMAMAGQDPPYAGVTKLQQFLPSVGASPA